MSWLLVSSRRAQKICLPRFSAVRNSVRHSCDDSQRCDSRQITASHREVALNRLVLPRVPGVRPVPASASKKISLASGGSCSLSHCFNATAAARPVTCVAQEHTRHVDYPLLGDRRYPAAG